MISTPLETEGGYRSMPPLAAAHLVTGMAWLVGGVGLGIYMATSHDFLLRPVHAHANLLGWATNALFGCFYWLRGGPARRREWLGFAAFNLGGMTMLSGLSDMLLNDSPPSAAMPIGTLLVAAGILQMLVAIAGALQVWQPSISFSKSEQNAITPGVHKELECHEG